MPTFLNVSQIPLRTFTVAFTVDIFKHPNLKISFIIVKRAILCPVPMRIDANMCVTSAPTPHIRWPHSKVTFINI